MKEAGVCSASIRTRESAGWMRCCSASKSKPRSVAMMISPSMTQRSGSSATAAATSSGKYRVIGRSLRLPSSTSSKSRKQIDLNPSHFGSKEASGGIVATDLDSIGETGGMTGSFIAPFSRAPTASGFAPAK